MAAEPKDSRCPMCGAKIGQPTSRRAADRVIARPEQGSAAQRAQGRKMLRAGTPTAVACAGTSRNTTAFAPIFA